MKRGQFWYGDFLVAVLILMIIGFLFVASIRDLTSRNEVLKDLILDASEISSTLMSEGTGTLENWQEGIGTLGLINNYKFSGSKWNDFDTLNYNQQKYMLGTLNNVWVYLKDRERIILDSSEEITSVQDIEANNLVHIKRFIFYGDDIHTLGVVVWR